MSNALESASLIMYPSGYSNGVLGSLKPTDGSGDFTFTRGSNLSATRVGPNGYIEKGYENLLLQSNTFSSSDWNNERLVSPIQTGFTGYDGSSDAWKLIPDTINNTHRISQLNSQTGVKTFSVYLKQAGYSKVRILAFGGNLNSWYFDLDAGVTFINPSNAIEYKATDVGNDWWRLQLTTQEAHNAYYVFVIDDAGNTTFIGDEVKGVLIQDAMLNQGLVAYPYIETTTAPVAGGILEDEPRIDFSDGCGHLLLEPSRTNRLILSEYFEGTGWFALGSPTITNNYGISPEGVQNSTRVVFSASSESIYSSIPYTSEEVSTIYVKGTGGETINFGKGDTVVVGTLFTLDGTWQRLEYVQSVSGTRFTINTGGGATARDIEIWGAQNEEGSYPTSYIPTYGVSQTRLRDSATASVTNTTSRTYFLSGKRLAAEGVANTSPIYDPNDNLAITFWSSNRFRFRFGGAVNSYYTLAGDDFKIAVSYNGTDSKVFINGQLEITQTFDLGNVSALTTNGNEGISYNQLLLFPTALSDDECMALTSL